MKIKQIYILFLSICLLLFLSSCKKEPGIGGTSSIKGKIYAKYYDKSFFILTASSYAPDIDVYIIYGGESTFGDRTRTNYDGSYEFKYLRNGEYKIFAYSRDSTGFYKYQVNRFAPEIAIFQKTEITKRNEHVKVPDINILQ